MAAHCCAYCVSSADGARQNSRSAQSARLANFQIPRDPKSVTTADLGATVQAMQARPASSAAQERSTTNPCRAHVVHVLPGMPWLRPEPQRAQPVTADYTVLSAPASHVWRAHPDEPTMYRGPLCAWPALPAHSPLTLAVMCVTGVCLGSMLPSIRARAVCAVLLVAPRI